MGAQDSEILCACVHVFYLVWHDQTAGPKQLSGEHTSKQRNQWWGLGLPEMTEIFLAEHDAELLQFAFIFGE